MDTPRIEEKPEILLIGMPDRFVHALSPDTNSMQVIGALWGRFAPISASVPHKTGDELYGVIREIPAERRDHPDQVEYLAAAAVTSDSEIPPGMVAGEIPATTYAVVTHRGRITRLADTLRKLYREWLPESGYEHSGIADVEVYGNRFHPDREDSEMEYWISVRPR